jgi:replication initiation protein RepC
MTQNYPTTPFGRRPMTLAMLTSQAAARECPADKTVHKWKIFRAITECKHRLGLSDRALSVLNALLSCLPETAMSAGPDLVVYPSNAQLSLRAHGMPATTLRRHMFALVDAGLVIRRDSPNGKRYARRGEGGSIEQAFGFDLTPIVARAEEFERGAAEVLRERREMAVAREQISVLRRDIGKMIAFGLEEGIRADWQAVQDIFRPLSLRIPRGVVPADLAGLLRDLSALAVRVGKLLELRADAEKMSGNDNHSGAHYQNSKADSHIDLEPASEEEGRTATPRSEPVAPSTKVGFPLGMILKACPDIAMYHRDGIATWKDLIATAGLVRGMLGISPSAWEEARQAMGDGEAAVAIAAILQKAEEIRSAGGYLRGLTAKAAAGHFSTGPMIMALLRRQAPKAGALAS